MSGRSCVWISWVLPLDWVIINLRIRIVWLALSYVFRQGLQITWRFSLWDSCKMLFRKMDRLANNDFLVGWLFPIFGELHDVVPHILDGLEQLQIFAVDIVPGIVIGGLEKVVVHIVDGVQCAVEFMVVASLQEIGWLGIILHESPIEICIIEKYLLSDQ